MDGPAGSQKACLPVIRGRVRWGPSLVFLSFFSMPIFFDLFPFLVDFGRCWEAKTEAKIEFWEVLCRCFFRVRFGIDFLWNLGGSDVEKSIKTIVFPMVFATFQKSDVFGKVAQKPPILESFSEAKTVKNREKIVLKTVCFLDIDFSSLFFDF